MTVKKEFIPFELADLKSLASNDLGPDYDISEDISPEQWNRLLQTFNDLRVVPLTCYDFDNMAQAEREYWRTGYVPHYNGDSWDIHFREEFSDQRPAVRFSQFAAPDLIFPVSG